MIVCKKRFFTAILILVFLNVCVLSCKKLKIYSKREVHSEQLSKKKEALNSPIIPANALFKTPWSMFQGDLHRTGRSPFVGPKRGIIKWNFPIEGLFEASPVIGVDGVIYAGGDNSRFYAVSPDGRLLWMFQTRDINRNSVAVASDGTLFLPSADHCVYALTPDGMVKWVFTTGGRVNSSPAIDGDGIIYFGSHDENLYAVNPYGTLRWKFSVGAISASSPAISNDGTIYVGSYDGNLYAVNKTGQLKWKFKADSGLRASPSIGDDGTIYIGSRKGTFYAMSPEGVLRWSYETGNDIRASAAIANDGTVYIGSWDNNFYAFSGSGKIKWSYKTNGPIEASAVIDAEGNVYVGAIGDKIYSFTQDGTVRWTIVGGMINTAPAIDSDGTIYICREHNLLAIGEPNPVIEIRTTKENTNSNVIKDVMIVKISNESLFDKDVDLKVFIRANMGIMIPLESARLVIKAGTSEEKKYEVPFNKLNMKKGSYFVVGRLLDAQVGTLLREEFKVFELNEQK